jgi:CrcB protein
MRILLLIGAGSFAGGIFRYLLSQYIQTKSFSTFPFGTLAVNIIGCFFIGIVFGLAGKGNVSHELKLILATGVLGGFTTFSAFSNETFTMFRDGQFWLAIVYILLSVFVGLAATFIGNAATKII